MATNPNIIQFAKVDPVFIKPENTAAYEAQKSLVQPTQTTSKLSKVMDLSKSGAFSAALQSGVSRFANLRQNNKPIRNSGAISQTPQSFKNLSTNLSNVGTLTTDWGGSTKFEKFHPALDLANQIGTPIPAFAEGTVTAVSTGHKQGDKAYGNYVIITDPWGNKHRYSHLNQAFVKVGDKVGKGQGIGEMGNSGQTYSTSGGTGSHLDYRIVNAAGKYINPYSIFNKST